MQAPSPHNLSPRLTSMARFLSKENWLLALLVFLPIALPLEYVDHVSALAIFLLAVYLILGMAFYWLPIGRAPEHR
jgi:hypothetical protein